MTCVDCAHWSEILPGGREMHLLRFGKCAIAQACARTREAAVAMSFHFTSTCRFDPSRWKARVQA